MSETATEKKCERQFSLPGGGTGTCGNVRLCPQCSRRQLRADRARRRTTLTAALGLAAVIGQTARDVPRIFVGRRP